MLLFFITTLRRPTLDGFFSFPSQARAKPHHLRPPNPIQQLIIKLCMLYHWFYRLLCIPSIQEILTCTTFGLFCCLWDQHHLLRRRHLSSVSSSFPDCAVPCDLLLLTSPMRSIWFSRSSLGRSGLFFPDSAEAVWWSCRTTRVIQRDLATVLASFKWSSSSRQHLHVSSLAAAATVFIDTSL
jgi:hypothetical protein